MKKSLLRKIITETKLVLLSDSAVPVIGIALTTLGRMLSLSDDSKTKHKP
jgi:hypothetical protein